MSNRVLLRLNTGAPDASLFSQGIQHSFFRPSQWQVISDKIRDIQINTQTQNLTLGQTITFEFDKVGTLAEDTKIDWYLSAITGSGSGTYVRACDYLGLALIPTVQINYQQNTIQTYSNVDLFLENIRDHDITHRQVFDYQLAGGLTPAQRNTRAAAAQKVRTYLKPYWYGLASHCPIITSLANKIKFKLTLASASDFVQTDYSGGATCSLSQVDFIYEVINTTGTERDQFSKLTFTPKGMTYLFQQNHDLLYQSIPSGSTSYTIDLKGFVLPFFALYGIFQRNSEVSTAYQKKLFELSWSDFRYINQITIKNGSTADFIVLKAPFDFSDQWQKHHVKAQWRQPIFGYFPSEVVDIKNVNLGSFDASNINNFQIKFEFTEALPVDFQVSIVNFEHNWINHQGGELQTVFN
jgi:hypothetical protein